jgi:2-C-methyl-D-erythritol 4-phosphate cytidylyltransferase
VTAGLKVAVVVPAGGSGMRMTGAGTRKQYLELGGEPILLRALRPFLEHPAVRWVVVALPAEDLRDPPIALPESVTVVEGGAERGDSVGRGLAAVPEDADIVAIHDAARPLLSRPVLDRVLEAARGGVGAVAGLPVVDTLKRVDGDRGVVETVDRRGLWRAQTPQAFPRAMITAAYRRAAEEGVRGTDDAALVERYGGTVVMVEGDACNLKVTRPADLALAQALDPLCSDPGATGG